MNQQNPWFVASEKCDLKFRPNAKYAVFSSRFTASRLLYLGFSLVLFQVKGFCGAQVFSDRAAGTVQSLTLWESWGDLETAVGDKRYAKVRLSGEYRHNGQVSVVLKC